MAKIKVEEPKTKVAEVQTVYRESEAQQTIPFSRD
jgi:hypothetical protein